jgi:hypothetical protein
LVQVFSRRNVARRLLRLRLPQIAREALKTSVSDQTRFDSRGIAFRHGMLTAIDWLLAEWPRRFVPAMLEARISWSDFQACEVASPFWLSSVCRGELDRKRYRVSDVEVEAAARTISGGEARPSKLAVKRVLGITEARSLDLVYPPSKCLTSAQLLRIAELLEADIRAAPERRDQRASHVRDAAGIAAAIQLRLSFSKACELEVKDGLALLEAWRATSTNAELPASLYARWMEEYLERTRVRFERFDRPQRALFLSRFGERNFGFGLAARFADLLRRAGVDQWARGARLLQHSVRSKRTDVCLHTTS